MALYRLVRASGGGRRAKLRTDDETPSRIFALLPPQLRTCTLAVGDCGGSGLFSVAAARQSTHADICSRDGDVRFVPSGDSCSAPSSVDAEKSGLVLVAACFEDLRALVRWGVRRGDLDHNITDGMRNAPIATPRTRLER
jgi:hypothetical protein